MNIPDKLYEEKYGKILEYDFIKTIHNEEEDVLEIIYSGNNLIRIFHYLETKNDFNIHLHKSLYFYDLWISKEDLIKSKIESYNKSIEHYKQSLEKINQRLNKLLAL